MTGEPKPNADRALARLRDPSGEALRELARLVVEDTTATPIREIASPRWMAGQLATAIEASTRGDGLHRFVGQRLDEGRAGWGAEERPLRELIPAEVDEALRKLLAREWTPDRALTDQLIDQGVFRDLLAQVLESSLRRFTSKLRDVDQDHLGGVGRRARDIGRGLGKGLFGGVAENLVGAVREEFEGVFERRIKDSLGSLTNEGLKVVSRHVTDPDNADDYGQARVAVFEVLLDTPVSRLSDELDKTGPEEMVDVVIAALRASVSRDDFVDVTERRVAKALTAAGDGTLGAWLDEIQLREVWTETTTELIAQRLQAVAETEAFEKWWINLFT